MLDLQETVSKSESIEKPKKSRTEYISEHKNQFIITISYCLAAVGLGLCIGMLGPTLLLLSAQIGRTADEIGLLFSVRGFGYLLGSTTGPLYDRMRAHVLMVLAIWLFASTFILASIVTELWQAILLWGIVGFGGGCVDTGVNTLVVWVWRDGVSPFVQAIHFSWGVGVFISPMLVARIYDFPLFTQYLIVAIPVFLTSIPFFILPSPKADVDYKTKLPLSAETTPDVDIEKQPLALNTDSSGPDSNVEQRIENMEPKDHEMIEVDPNSAVLSAVQEPKSVETNESLISNQTVPAKGKMSEIEVILFIATFLCFYVGAELGYGSWIFLYAFKQLKITEVQAAYITAAFWGSFTFARMAAIGIAVYLSPKMMILTDIAGCTVALLILSLGPGTEAVLWIGSIILGASLASIFPTAIALPQSLGVPVTGKGTSWIVVGGSLGEMVIPMTIGFIQDAFGAWTFPYVIFLTLSIALLVYIVMLTRVSYVTNNKIPFLHLLKRKNTFIRLDSTIQ